MHWYIYLRYIRSQLPRVRGLSIVLQDVEVVSAQCDLTKRQKVNLEEITANCHNVLLDLEKMLDKYADLHIRDAKLSCRMKRAWKRLEFEPDDIHQLRERLTSNVALLTSYMGQISRYLFALLCWRNMVSNLLAAKRLLRCGKGSNF